MRLLNKNFIIIFTTLTFMPILTYKFNIRYEQSFIYLTTLLFLPTIFYQFFKFDNLIKIYPFLFFFFIAFIQGITFYFNNIFYHNYSFYGFISNLEDILFVLTIITLLNIIYSDIQIKKITESQKKFYVFLIFFMVINAIFAILSFFNIEFYKHLHQLYISLDDIEKLATTSSRAYTHRKVFGIFDTPSGAGILYFLSILAVMSVYKNLQKPAPLIILMILIIGGLLSFSKTFLITVPFLFIYFFNISNTKAKVVVSTLFFLIIFVNIDSLKLFFERVSYDPNRFIDFLTSGRYFASDSPISQNFYDLNTYSPLLGFGAGVFQASERPADSLMSYVGFIGGYTSIMIFLFYIVYIGYKIFLSWKVNFQIQIIHILYIYLLICSFGATIFFTNRLAGIVIIFFFLEYKKQCLQNNEKENTNI